MCSVCGRQSELKRARVLSKGKLLALNDEVQLVPIDILHREFRRGLLATLFAVRLMGICSCIIQSMLQLFLCVEFGCSASAASSRRPGKAAVMHSSHRAAVERGWEGPP